MSKNPTEKKISFTIVLPPQSYAALKAMAAQESRPLAQLARVIIEKAVAEK